MEDVRISRKKPVYGVSPALRKYLRHYEREARMPISYKHLLDFYETLPVMDKNGRDTLWETPIYPPTYSGKPIQWAENHLCAAESVGEYPHRGTQVYRPGGILFFWQYTPV